MTIDNGDRRRILFSQDIECPVCQKTAHAFRILPGINLGAPAGEFYHGAAVCVGATLADTPAALTLQRRVGADPLVDLGRSGATIRIST